MGVQTTHSFGVGADLLWDHYSTFSRRSVLRDALEEKNRKAESEEDHERKKGKGRRKKRRSGDEIGRLRY